MSDRWGRNGNTSTNRIVDHGRGRKREVAGNGCVCSLFHACGLIDNEQTSGQCIIVRENTMMNGNVKTITQMLMALCYLTEWYKVLSIELYKAQQ